MAQITVQGRPVTVSDNFFQLPPDQQEATVDEIAASFGPSEQMQSNLGELSAMTQAPKAGMNAIANKRALDEHMALPAWKRAATTLVDLPGLLANGGTYGNLDELAAAARSKMFGTDYEKEFATLNRQTEDARARQGYVGTAAEILGSIGTGGLAAKGLTKAVGYVAPNVVKTFAAAAPTASKAKKAVNYALRTGLAGAEGAGQGALTALGEGQDVGEGGLWGGLFGVGGKFVGDSASELATSASKKFKSLFAGPEKRAGQKVYDAAERVGFDKIDDMLTRHGPETRNVDVLGQRGYDMGRTASNYSSEADEAFKEALSARKGGQNTRLIEKVAEAGDITPETTVKSLKEAAMDLQRPGINKAYTVAKEVGADLPRGPFENILNSPMGRKVYDEAGESLQNLAAAEGGGVYSAANSELARLDLAAQKLREIKVSAYANKTPSVAKEAENLERALKKALADSLAGPEWAEARRLRRTAGEIDESFDVGQQLAKPTVRADTPAKATQAASPKAVRQSWAAETIDKLGNKDNTQGALSIFNPPMQVKGRQTALGPRLPIVDDALGTERLFEKANKALTGNSSTAKQLIQGGLLGGATGAVSTGEFDPLNPMWWAQVGAGAGLGAGGRVGIAKAGPTVMNAIGASRVAKEAPYIAQLLLGHGINPTRPIPAGALEKFSVSQRDAIRRAITLGLIQSNQPAER